MDALYSKQDFYLRARKEFPNLHEDILVALIERAKKAAEEGIKLDIARAITKLELEDEILNKVRYYEFAGNKSVNDKELSNLGYYPLHEFLTIRNTPQLVSLWLAPKALLYAIFQNDEVVNEICQL